jgi:hypothetical protein
MKSQNNVNVLVCGSTKFEDRSFVYGILDALYNQMNGNLSGVITSRFSGASSFAKEWAINLKDTVGADISILEYNFDGLLEEKNVTLYEDPNLPEFIIKNDDFFQRGKERLIESGVKAVLAFPNAEGILGAATLNIKRFAQLASIPCLDCVQAHEMICSCREIEHAHGSEADVGPVVLNGNKSNKPSI